MDIFGGIILPTSVSSEENKGPTFQQQGVGNKQMRKFIVTEGVTLKKSKAG